MTPERWQEIKRLLDDALDQEPEERTSYIRRRSGDDAELRDEVLSLLASHEEAGDFLEEPALEAKAVAAPPQQQDLAGTRLGPWKLVREIGRGGMGAVYLAVRADNEFRKRVAVKLIRRDMESGFAISRFRNERQILARLEHPNIARLIDGGTTGGGFPYFIMEYVEGEPLLPYCESRSLPLPARVQIFRKVCEAVEYAHRRMIVHRDLKPSNILVKQDATPKLLDFGVAKILDPDRSDERPDETLAGFRLITPAYASPEQIRGEPATVASDVYSLGIVLWELITGRVPRERGGALSFDMPDTGPADTASRLVHNLRNVVLKAVRDKPSDRYESVELMSADLDRALAGIDVPAEETAPAEPVRTGPQQNSVAVLPFQFLGTETAEAYLGLGIADAVITRLSNIGRIAVRPTGAVMRFAGGCDATEAGRELNVEYVLEGRVQKLQERVRVTVQLVDMRSARPVWATGFSEQLEDLLKMEDSISAQVAQAVVPHMTGEEQEELSRSGTASPKAHQAYLRGRWYWNQHTEESLPHALVLFTEAVAEDPKYAQAHAGIADYHIALGMRGLLPPREAFAAAIVSARSAIELDPRLAEAHASLGLAKWAQEGDYETASHHLQLAIALNPDYAVAHDWYGLMNSARGRPVIAIASIERAKRLDTSNAMYVADLAMCHYNCRDFTQVRKVFQNAGGALEPPAFINGAVLPLSLMASGKLGEALESARGYWEAMGRSAWGMAILARVEAGAGNHETARRLMSELETRAKDYYVPGVALALGAMACGDVQAATRHLERGCRDREWWTMYLAMMPVWDELRTTTRFARVSKPSRKAALPADTELALPQSVRRRTPGTVLRMALIAAAVLVAAILVFLVGNTR